MTDEKKIKVAFISLIIAFIIEAINLLTQLTERVNNVLWGVQLILVLFGLGISAKMLGNFTANKNLKIKSRIILFFASLLAIYAFIL